MTARIVAVVDDDESVRESVPDLLGSYGLEARAYASAERFLATADLGEIDCLLLDVAMPGMSGPDLQEELIRLGRDIPIIFITAHSDDVALRQAMKRGAVARLLKPFNEPALLEAISVALARRERGAR